MDEKKKAEELAVQKVKDEADAKAKADLEANEPIRLLAEKDEKIVKLTEDLENYKHVALKRLGKLPGDDGFVAGVDEKTGLTIEEQIKKVLLEQEISRAQIDKDNVIKTQAKQITELTLALKNRPGSSIGDGSGESLEVKDNIFTESQIAEIRARGERLKVKDIDAFIERAKQNLLKNR